MLYLKCAVIIAAHVSFIFHCPDSLPVHLGGVSSDVYPGPFRFAQFLSIYSRCVEGPIRCFSPDGPLYLDTTGTVLVDTFGLSVVEFRSVVTHESAMFGSGYRGYLIVFPYILVNGPDVGSFSLSGRMQLNKLLMSYTDDHMVLF